MILFIFAGKNCLKMNFIKLLIIIFLSIHNIFSNSFFPL
jgi:hypothetical protein